jgi:hypothetical protein
MSKLADAIRRSQRVEAAPMGFGAQRAAARPTMLVGYLGLAGQAEEALKAGADVVVVDAGGSAAAAVAALRKSAPDAAFGVRTQVANADAAKALREAGFDFLLVEPEATPAAALLDDDLGYVLVLAQAPEEPFLRSLEQLNLEAVLIPKPSLPLTVAGQIELGRVGLLARRPLFCEAGPEATNEDLQCLRAAGVAVLLVKNAGEIARLKETVAALPPRRQRREERAVVSLPRGRAPEESDEDDRLRL